ncbi:MAG: DUF1549 domain-containing protein [Planctomycetota bacterium]
MIASRKFVLGTLVALATGCFVVSSAVQAEDSKTTAPPADEKKTEAKKVPLRNLINAEIKKVWKRDEVTPAAKSTDEEFLRRIYLDVVGMQPTATETRAFLSNDAKDKREKLIETLLADVRFGQTVTDRWIDAWAGESRAGSEAMIFADWLSKRINAGDGFDDVIYDIIAAKGTILDNPGIAYYASRRSSQIPDIAGEAVKHFTGVQLQCAQCHDHNYEPDWTMEEFNGVASFFAGMRITRNNSQRPVLTAVSSRSVNVLPAETLAGQVSKMKAKDETAAKNFYEKNRYRSPKYLMGNKVRANTNLWRRAWAKHATSDSNDQSNRYWANRLWSFLLGTGIYNPIDDFNSFNEASHPELLEILAEEFRGMNHDIRAFYREILNSEVYQLSSQPGKWGKHGPENWHFASYPVKQLSANQFVGAMLSIGMQGERPRGIIKRVGNPYERERRQGMDYEKRKKAGKLRENERVRSYNFKLIDQLEERWNVIDKDWAARRSTTAGLTKNVSDAAITLDDTEFSMTLPETLLRVNGKFTQAIANAGRGSLLDGIIKRNSKAEAQVEELVIVMLCRYPTKSESKRFVNFVKEGRSKSQAMEDLMFALLNTTEFATNH